MKLQLIFLFFFISCSFNEEQEKDLKKSDDLYFDIYKGPSCTVDLYADNMHARFCYMGTLVHPGDAYYDTIGNCKITIESNDIVYSKSDEPCLFSQGDFYCLFQNPNTKEIGVLMGSTEFLSSRCKALKGIIKKVD